MNIVAVYKKTHETIEPDSYLMSAIRAWLEPTNHCRSGFVKTNIKMGHKDLIGREGPIFLGIDFIERHRDRFDKILTNYRLIDHLSQNTADLPRVFIKLIYNGEHIANLVEDVSEGGEYKVDSDGITFGPYQFLRKFFEDEDLHRAVFIVYRRNKQERTSLRRPTDYKIHRLPIVDVDHIELPSEFKELYSAPNPDEWEDLFQLEFEGPVLL